MDKRDLVELTIERLLANFETSPESFELKDSGLDNLYSGVTIVWRPKIQLNNYDHVVNDPNNNHSVVVILCPNTSRISCYLFLKAPPTYDGARADYAVSSLELFMRWRSHYRKLRKLVKLIRARDLYRENMQYLSKLSSVFPDTLDKHFLKD